MAKASPKVRAEWQARVKRLNRSGLSVGAFAAREGVHPGTLALWRARLEKVPATTKKTSSSTALAFVALDPVARTPPATSVPFELAIGSRTIRVWPHFDVSELLRLVRALEEATA
jgi:hypothetical protein